MEVPKEKLFWKKNRMLFHTGKICTWLVTERKIIWKKENKIKNELKQVPEIYGKKYFSRKILKNA